MDEHVLLRHRLSFECQGAVKLLHKAARVGSRLSRRSSRASGCRGNTSINNITIRYL